MFHVGFEPTISAGERPQTYALDYVATGTGVPESLGFQISRQSAHERARVASPMQRSPLPQGNIPGTHFCYRLRLPQGPNVAGRIMLMKNSSDTIGNRTCDLFPLTGSYYTFIFSLFTPSQRVTPILKKGGGCLYLIYCPEIKKKLKRRPYGEYK